jgi:hypothetical protein
MGLFNIDDTIQDIRNDVLKRVDLFIFLVVLNATLLGTIIFFLYKILDALVRLRRDLRNTAVPMGGRRVDAKRE